MGRKCLFPRCDNTKVLFATRVTWDESYLSDNLIIWDTQSLGACGRFVVAYQHMWKICLQQTFYTRELCVSAITVMTRGGYYYGSTRDMRVHAFIFLPDFPRRQIRRMRYFMKHK